MSALKVLAAGFNPLQDVRLGRQRKFSVVPTMHLTIDGHNHTADKL